MVLEELVDVGPRTRIVRVATALASVVIMGALVAGCAIDLRPPQHPALAPAAPTPDATFSAPAPAASSQAATHPPAPTQRSLPPATHSAAALRARLRDAAKSGFIVGPLKYHGPTVSIDESFRFQGKRHTVRFSVPASDLAWSHDRELSVTVFAGETRESQLRRFWKTVTLEPHQAALYDSLGASLRSIQRSARLGPDEYAELLTAYVQQMPYDTTEVETGGSNRYPVVTAFGGTGVCGDKSILLAGLLAHEGYRVSLLEFGPESHMAVGIGARGAGYRGTHLAFIETTGPGLIGEVGKSYGPGGRITLKSDPVVIPIATSGTDYRAGDQVNYVLDREQAYERTYTSLDSRVTAAEPRLDRYDAAAVNRYNDMVRRLNRAATTLNTVMDHADDREALYAYMKWRGAP